jgi:hypothetical protein
MIGTDRGLGRTIGIMASLTIHVAVAIALWPGQPVVPVSTGDGPTVAASDGSKASPSAVESRGGTQARLTRLGARDSRLGARGSTAGLRNDRIRGPRNVAALIEGVPVGDRGVVDHLWQSTLFAVCAGLLTLGFRRNRARIQSNGRPEIDVD